MAGIPSSLRTWFVVHFVVDLIFAVPLIFFPVSFLTFFGFLTVDPLATRLVGAALFGIGTTSLLTRNKGMVSYQSLLTLKILWSSAAIFGVLLSIAQGAPLTSWLVLGIFALFLGVWVYYKRKLKL